MHLPFVPVPDDDDGDLDVEMTTPFVARLVAPRRAKDAIEHAEGVVESTDSAVAALWCDASSNMLEGHSGMGIAWLEEGAVNCVKYTLPGVGDSRHAETFAIARAIRLASYCIANPVREGPGPRTVVIMTDCRSVIEELRKLDNGAIRLTDPGREHLADLVAAGAAFNAAWLSSKWFHHNGAHTSLLTDLTVRRHQASFRSSCILCRNISFLIFTSVLIASADNSLERPTLTNFKIFQCEPLVSTPSTLQSRDWIVESFQDVMD